MTVGRRASVVACSLLSAGALVSGCGLAPGRPAREATPATPVAVAQARHEYPSRVVRQPPASPGSPSAAAAVRAFAQSYINWSADTVAGDLRELASRSIGQARSAMLLAAAEVAGDYELQRGGVGNQGTVETVAPLPGRMDRYVVVTRELTTATATQAYQGLAPAWHVAVATVSELAPGDWVISGWQPEG